MKGSQDQNTDELSPKFDDHLKKFGSEKRQWCITWEEYFMGIALISSQRSKDPVTQVGAVIVNNDNRIVGVGYNGMPNGIKDDDIIWGKSSDNFLLTKRPYVCHAEMNCILNKLSADIRGCTMYVTLYPCNNCSKMIIQSGIKQVIYYDDKNRNRVHAGASMLMLQKAGVEIRKYRPTNTQFVIGHLSSKL